MSVIAAFYKPLLLTPHSSLDVDTEDKVFRIKESVEEKEGIPPAQQRLIFSGKQMADDKTVKEVNIEPGATIHLVLALRGGILVLG